MKKMLLFVLLFAAAMTFDAAGQTPAVYIEDLHAVIGSQVEIPVRVEDFQNVGATTIDYAYDPAVLTFFDYDDPQELGGFVINAFNTGDDYWIRIAWNDLSGNPNGVSLADGSKFISIIFTYHGGVSTFSFVEANCTVLLLPAFEEIYLNTSNGSIDETIAGVVIPDMYVLPGQIHVPILVNFSTINYGAGAFTFAIVFNDDHLEFTGLANTAFTGILPYHDGGTSPVYLQWENSINPLDPHDGKFLHGLLLHMVFNFTGTQDTPLNFDLDYCVVSNNQAYTVNVEYTNGMLYYCPELTADISASDVTCNGAGDGSIAITNAAGAPSGEYEYRLDDGAWQSADVFNNLIPGTYTVYIRDAVNNYCEYELGDATVVEPDAIDVFFTIDGNPLLPFQTIPFCFDIEEIFLAVVNEQGAQTAVGEPPFAIAFTVNDVPYLLENITYGVQVNLVDYLPQGPYPGQIAAGEYLVEITSLIDANNCSLSEGALAYYKFTLLINPQPDVFFTIDDNPLLPYQTIPYCFDIDQIMLTLVNEQGGQPAVGTPPFMIEFTINGGTPLVFENQNYNDDINLVEFLPEGPYPGQVAAGSYEVQVTGFSDANGCGLVPNAMQYYNFTLVINPQPDVFLTIDDVPLLPFSEHEYCYNTSAIMLALVDEQGGQPAVGTPPFMIEFKINGGTPIVLTDVEYDVDISLVNYLPFGPYPGQIAAGSYEVQVTGFSDANGCGLVPNAMQYYNFTLMINPQPVVSDASLQYSSDNEVSWDAAGGSFEGGFEICLDPVINEDEFYYLDVNTFITSEALAENFLNPFYLTDASSATFVSWWTAKFAQWNDPAMEAAMQSILDGTNPMFYIKYTGSDFQLIDGFMYLLTGNEQTLRLDSDYPPGNYTFTGAVTDVNTCISEEFDVVMEFYHTSTYAFDFVVPADICATTELTIPVTFGTDTEGGCGYDGVRFKIEASGPGTVTFGATDSNDEYYTFDDNGFWGPSAGFNLPAFYTATTDWDLEFSASGNYAITFSLIYSPDNGVVAGITETVNLTVNALPVVSDASLQYSSDNEVSWDAAGGSFEGGFEICLDPVINEDEFYYLDVNTFITSEALAENFLNPFYLTDVSSATFAAWWAAKFVQWNDAPMQAAMESILDGSNPMFYLKYTGSDYQLIDGFMYLLTGNEQTLRLDSDYPPGNYTFTGAVTDVNTCVSEAFNVVITFKHHSFVACPEDITVNNEPGLCTAEVSFEAVSSGVPTPSVTFEVDGSPISSPHTFPVGITVVNVSSENDCGVSTCSFTVTVIDAEEPIVPADGFASVECLSEAMPPVPPTIMDNCSGEIEGVLHSMIDTPEVITCNGTRVYTYSYTDGAENTVYWSYTYTIERSTFPVEVGGPVATQATIECTADVIPPSAPVPQGFESFENLGITGTSYQDGTFIGQDGSEWTFTQCRGDYEITGKAIMLGRNRAPQSEFYSGSISNGIGVLNFDYMQAFSTNVDLSVLVNGIVVGTVTSSGEQGIVKNSGDIVVNIADDFIIKFINVNNSDGQVLIDNVSWTTYPSLTAVLPVVEDVCGNILPAPVPVIVETFDPLGCQGTIRYEYTYTDCAGLQFEWSFTYTIEAPVVEMPDNAGMEVSCPSQATQPTAPVVADNCGRNLELVSLIQTSDNTEGCTGTIVWTATYKDCNDATYFWTYTYTVLAPVVEMPENGASDIACPSQAVQPTTPVVADNCGRDLELVSLLQTSDNTAGCTGTIVWTATYKDCNDATYFWTYTYTVLAPVVEMPENGASDIACPSQAVQPTAPVVADNCGRNLELVSIVQTSDNTAGCTGTIVWTATYKDCNDATYFWTYTYTVLAPVVEMPANLSMVVACPGLAMQLIAPEVLDNCGRLLLFIGSTTTNTYNGCEGSVTYIYNYQDCAGNSYSWTLSYDILPLTGPLLVDENVDCSSLNQSGLPYSLEQAQAINPEELIPDVEALYTDNCGGEVTAVVTSVVAGLPGMTNSDQFWYFEYVFTISDGCGNTTTCSVTYSGSIVPETVVISQGTVRKEQIICYGATETITISGLQVFGSLQLIAGQSIHLLPGFKVHYDGYLHAYIGDTYCENPEAIVVSKETEVLPKDDFNSMGEAGDLFRIFPNPTTGTFILEMMDVDETSAIVVEIYNILGERIIQHDLFGYQQYEFNISDLSNGVYVVRTLQGDRFATQRIIKQ